jgi:hypothetical protein
MRHVRPQDYVRELQTITEERNIVTEELIATEAKLTAAQVLLEQWV